MFVYGDPRFRVTLVESLNRLQGKAAKLVRGSLDEVRCFLIQLGQLEQALADAQPHSTLSNDVSLPAKLIGDALDHTALVFLRAWQPHHVVTNSQAEIAWHNVLQILGGIRTRPDLELDIKVPEGFAFYSLYPEQFIIAAERWCADRARVDPKQALVIGIRSIGTTLSAVVSTVLRARGWQVHRMTVRPVGHPYDRQVELKPDEIKNVRGYIIVDEGPGRSGSSMAAVARKLRSLSQVDIAFFPGHAGLPGPDASPEILRLWQEVPKYHAEVDELRFGQRTLTELLSGATAQLCGEPCGLPDVRDLSAGAWRQYTFQSAEEWPGVFGALERAKYLCGVPGKRRIMWKFTGLDCPVPAHGALAGTATMHLREMSIQRVGSVAGFTGYDWLEGMRLRRGDGRRMDVVMQCAAYIRSAARQELGAAEVERGILRLEEMLYWNTHELLGEQAAEKTRRWSRHALEQDALLSYGDGRLAPWEWVRSKNGPVIKTDVEGHSFDHTCVGPQPWLWDAAGFLAEWHTSASSRQAFLSELSRCFSANYSSEALSFFLLAYLAFRAGVCSMGISTTVWGREKKSLERDLDFYRTKLKHLLLG